MMPDLNFLTHYLGELAGVLIVLLVILAIFSKMLGIHGERLLGSIFRGIGTLLTTVLTPIVSSLWSIFVQIAGHMAALVGRIITAIFDSIQYGGNSSTKNSKPKQITSNHDQSNQIKATSREDFGYTISLGDVVAEQQPAVSSKGTATSGAPAYVSPYDQPPDIIIIHNSDEENS